MATQLETANFTYQNFYVGYLSADASAVDTDIFLDVTPTGTEGTLIIDPDSTTNREIVYYTSRTATKVTTPANGRGYDNTTAAAHTSGTKVIMAPIADWFNSLRTLFTTTPQGWTSVGYTPDTVTALGNHSYSMVFNSVDLSGTLSAGMRLRTTRTVAAPTRSTSLNGTTQYYSKSSPSGTTFTDDFVVSAWVKLSSYAATAIASRYNGTSGWTLNVDGTGQVALVGYNAGAANYSYVLSYQSLPLNKWVHVAAQLDMSTFTATTTTSYIMIDGVNVPASVARSGTSPTALIQAGDLQIGASNGGAFFPGKIAQVAIYSAKVTQATILASMNQGLSGSETSLISAYSFDNSITDLKTGTANNLTPNGSAVATSADSPFGGQADGTISSTLDYAIITKVAFSTNTTVTVQVPEGCTIPTSGGVSAVSYATVGVPYNFPKQRGKWVLLCLHKAQSTQGSAANGTWYNVGSQSLNIPVGEWRLGYQTSPLASTASAVITGQTLSTANNSETDSMFTSQLYYNTGAVMGSPRNRYRDISLAAATPYYLNTVQQGGTSVTLYNLDTGVGGGPSIVEAELAYL